MLLCLWVQKRGSSLRSGWGYWMARGWRNNKQRSLASALALPSSCCVRAWCMYAINISIDIDIAIACVFQRKIKLFIWVSCCRCILLPIISALIFFLYLFLSLFVSCFFVFMLSLLVLIGAFCIINNIYLIFSCLADHVSDWQPPIIILGVCMVEVPKRLLCE